MSGFKKAQNPLGPGAKERWVAMKLPKQTLYVSNLGRIRSLRWDYLKERLYQGYRAVGRNKVYRLVAEGFLPRVPGCNVVNHLDGIKQHDWVFNLEWTTHKGNAEHAQRMGFYLPTTGSNHWTAREPWRRKTGERNGRAKLSKEEVLEIRASSTSLRNAAQQYGVTKTAISAIRKRKLWRHL